MPTCLAGILLLCCVGILAAQGAEGEAPESATPTGVETKGFRAVPVPGMHQVELWHWAVPRTRWNLRIPEHSYPRPDGPGSVRVTDVIWERDEKSNQLRFRWGADDALKREQSLDFSGAVTVRENVIDFSLTVKNIGDEAWDKPRMTLFCLMAPDSPDFADYEAERTFVRRAGEWVTMGEVLDHKFADHRMATVSAGPPPRDVSRLAAKVSADGKYVTGIAADVASSLSFNFQVRTSCMHSNPNWGRLEPGQERTATGKVYFLEGTVDDLWRIYSRDFE